MKKICFGILLLISIISIGYSQELNVNQIRFNNVIFTIGVNKYSNDYDIIFNKWYKGYTSSNDVKRGEPIDWINPFTDNYTIEALEYDVSINHKLIGQNLHGILFLRKNGGNITLIYDNSGILSFVDIQKASDVDFHPVPQYNIASTRYSEDDFIFTNNILTEPLFTGLGLSFSLYGIKIINFNTALLAEIKPDFDWVFDYEKRTGKRMQVTNELEKLKGLEYSKSSIRIARENENAVRIENERQRQEKERIEKEQAEQQRLARLEQLRLEQERKAEEQRIVREQAEQQRLERERKANMEQQQREREFINSIRALTNVQSIVANAGGRDYEIKIGDSTGPSILTSTFNNHNYGKYQFSNTTNGFVVSLDGEELIILDLDRRGKLTKITIMPNLKLLGIVTTNQNRIRLW
jgi:hypothetical protein